VLATIGTSSSPLSSAVIRKHTSCGAALLRSATRATSSPGPGGPVAPAWRFRGQILRPRR
jgi:hypothetical protein